MPRNAAHTAPVTRNRSQAIRSARIFADGLRRLDRGSDFDIFQASQEIVIARTVTSSRFPAITDILGLVAKHVASGGELDDVHVHWDGDSLSMFFTETSV